MSNSISRRKVLATGIATAGALVGSITTRNAHAWPPGPKENVERNLTPGDTPIRLGGFLQPTRKFPENVSITEVVKKLRDDGFGGCHSFPRPLYGLKDSQIRELNAALKEYDVVIYEVGGYTNMIHPDRAKRQENLKGLARCFEVAAKVNCPMVGTITGSCDPDYGINVHPENWSEETWKLTVESVKQVLRDTAGTKVTIGMEAQVTTNLDGPRAHKRLNDDVGDPRCCVNLDPTNMMSLSNYYHTTDLLNECFDLLGESIMGCHAKDTYIWPDKQTVHVQEVCPGRGVMDYETFLVRMSRMKWPRTLLTEHIPNDQLPEAYAYIRKVADKVGVKMYR